MAAPLTRVLRAEPLEGRDLPAMLGAAWPDATALTLSFAPDGTRNGFVRSSLFQTLNHVADRADWEREVLRAFQTWAAVADVDVGLVRDSGGLFGAAGDVQGDYRFGDIRVGGVPLTGPLANNTPFSWGAGTWSGDVLLNTGVPFGIDPAAGSGLFDLFTVVLHEAGNVLGVPDSADPASAVAKYTAPRTGLSAADIAAVRSNYGARPADPYEGPTGNGTFATAAPLPDGTAPLRASLRDGSDVDVYSFVQPAGGTSATVRVLTRGVSLLCPQVTVYDAAGNVVGSATTTDPLKGDAVVSLSNLVPGARYYVRVAGATADVFGVGRYRLSVAFSEDWKDPTLDPFVKDTGTNETAAAAVPLDPPVSATGATALTTYNGALEGAADVDYYRVTTPVLWDGVDPAMVVRVRTMQTNRAAPAVAVFDAAGHPLQLQVLANDGATLTVQVLGIRRGADYFVRLTAPAGGADATGNYRLMAGFQPPDGSTLTKLQSGQVGAGAAAAAPAGGTLVLQQSRLFRFSFFTGTADGSAGVPVTVTVADAAGRAVFTLTQTAGQLLATGAVYLNAGAYTITVAASAPGGHSAPPTNYWLYAGVASDPIDPYPTTTTTTTTTTMPTTTTTPTTPMPATTTTGATPDVTYADTLLKTYLSYMGIGVGYFYGF